jgi:hypothetical protein
VKERYFICAIQHGMATSEISSIFCGAGGELSGNPTKDSKAATSRSKSGGSESGEAIDRAETTWKGWRLGFCSKRTHSIISPCELSFYRLYIL